MKLQSSIKPFPKIDNTHAISIPLPEDTQLLTANLYAVGTGPVTLIDTGLKYPGLLDFVREQLQTIGFGFEDIERIIATHGHVDHTGLTAEIRKAAGHPIDFHIHPEDNWLISEERHQDYMWSNQADSLTAVAGIPVNEVEKIKQRFSFFKELSDPVDNVSYLNDGDAFSGDGYHLKIIHTPGHTAGSICVYEQKQRILFSGDNLIKHITPNPLVDIRKYGLRKSDYQSLPTFLKTLDNISKLDVRYVFSGHGEYMDDMHQIISTYRAHHRRRMDSIWKALKKSSRPIYQLIDDVFPVVPEGDIFLAVSEIAVHLEVLINEGLAELIEPGPPAVFKAM
jgi:glyoxylase-like metal-dependent hydrolase (beta-lactamase superfamily II)